MRTAVLMLAAAAAVASAEHWVASVPKGKTDADRLAEEHGLRNAGEVVPDSNVFYFKLPKGSDRRKRAAGAADIDVLSRHSDVEFLEKQTERLTRVKRVPIPQEDAGNELCFIHTEATREKDSTRCVFPFTFKGKTHLRCTADESANAQEWCATEVDAEGEVITGQWGDCDFSNIKCFTLGGSRPTSSQQRTSRPPPRPAPRQRLPARLPPQAQRLPPQSSPRFNNNPFLQNGPQGGGGRIPFSDLPPEAFGRRPLPQQPRLPPQGQFLRPGQGRPPLPQRPPGPQLPLRGEPRFQPFRPPLRGGGGGFGVNLVDNEVDRKPANLSAFKTYLTDKMWPKMWFINRGGDLDMNVEDAWAQGYTGKGVKVTILDDGIEHTHADLRTNYDPDASIDLNDDDGDPFPRYDFINSNKHGTRCAGTVAAAANNSECSVGIAYDAKIGGVRILDGHIIDVLEAQALSFNRSYIDIYSASWGPDDNGKTVDGPGKYASRALKDGVEEGRGGKGSIFVWASGNGGKYLDNCNADGYTTSVYTLSVSSASENGQIPWYSEQCSSSIASTYSSGSKRYAERKIITTDLHGRCTDQHTGTSASSPMAAGIVALALEANPELNWRDVQHITVRTSRPKGNLKAEDWSTNGVGRQFSHAFGFGLMDAGAMTRMAKDWKTVPEQISCNTPNALDEPILIGAREERPIKLDASSCKSIKFLEHLHLHIDLKTQSRRGDLSVMVRSPSKTVSILLAPRPFDDIRTGLDLFEKWPMMSVHFWSEPVVTEDGDWYLFVKNDGDEPATLINFRVTFYGTEVDPQPGVPNFVDRPQQKEPEITTRRPTGTFTKNFAHPTPKKFTAASSNPFTKEFAHPSKDSEEEKGGGFAKGYGVVDAAELSVLLAADEEFNASLDLARISAEDELNSRGEETSADLAHPSKQENDSEEEKGGGFAEGYGLVDTAELSALLAADEEFNANLDLARISTEDELNSPAITKETSAVDRADLGEDELDIAEAAEEEQSAAGVALLHAAIAEVDEIQPKTLDISAE